VQLSLLGMNHSHQLFGQKDGDSAALYSHLSNLLLSRRYDAIAEELNEEAITQWGCNESTARKAANAFGVPHCFCDPDSSERVGIGIPSCENLKKILGIGKFADQKATAKLDAAVKRFWPVREEFWLNRLRQLRCSHALFILGADHVPSFSALLEREAIGFECLNPHWEPS